MAEETVHLMKASKRANLPTPTFDGTSDVDTFIHQFTRVAQLMQWEEPEAAIRFQMAISGPAKKGLTATSFEGMCTQLTSRYRLSEDSAVKLLKSLKWKANDNVHEFAAYVRKLVEKAFPELDDTQQEKRAIKELTNALPSGCQPLSWELRHRTPDSYEEVVELVQSFGELNFGGPNRINQVETDEVSCLRKEVAAQAALIEQMVASQAQMQKQLSAALTQIQPRRTPITCYRCQKTGHMARSCPTMPRPAPKLQAENGNVQQGQA